MPAELALTSRVEALDAFVDLLSADVPTPSRDFYDRMCETSCRLAAMERAMLFIYDPVLHRVRAAGCHGVAPDIPDKLQVTLEEAPIARRALAEDRVIEVSEDIESQVPPYLARMFGITTLTCTPLSAAGRWFGVMCADRGGGRFELTDDERHAMWTLGKMGALAASAGMAMRQSERLRLLSDRIDLARDIHEQVIQRLFGVSLALSSDRELTPEERRRCGDELHQALDELRNALSRPLARDALPTEARLADELGRLVRVYSQLPIAVEWVDDAAVPEDLEPLAQRVVGEALRNVAKHAAPTRVVVSVSAGPGNFTLEVENDGVDGSGPGAGMGLRLAAFEALQHGGILEFGSPGPGLWRVKLTVARDAA
jgi:signal transduction histidine kinase